MSDLYVGTFDEIDGETESERRAHRPIRFKLTPFEQIQISADPTYIVKGIIPRGGLVIVFGPPKCGKSFWTFDLAMHVALGRRYRGRRVQQGGVVYLALEGGGGFANRVEAWRQRHLNGHDKLVPFYLLNVPIDLAADHLALIAAIRAQIAIPPSIVTIDTLNRALLGDENSPIDMAKFIRAADAIRAAFGCTVIIVHHCGVQGGRPRGHTSLSGADDAQVSVERDKDSGAITVKIEHMKDGDASAPIVSKLERVDLGDDSDGDPLTSCVIIPAKAPVPEPKLPHGAKLAFDLLKALTATDGKPPASADNIPAKARPVSAITWRERFYDAYPTTKSDAKQKAYVRALLKLQEEKLIEIWSTWVWLTEQPDKPDIGDF